MRANSPPEALELYRELGDPYGVARALAELGWYDLIRGTGERGRRFVEAFELRRRHGDDRRLVEPLIDAAWLALVQGHQGTARARFLDCLEGRGRSTTGSWSARRSPACRRWPEPSRAGALRAARRRLRARPEQIGAPPWEPVVMLQERATSAAREALGPGTYDQFVQRGVRYGSTTWSG